MQKFKKESFIKVEVRAINNISKEDYLKLEQLAYELKEIRDKYDFKEIKLESMRHLDNFESLNIMARCRELRDFYMNSLIFNSEKTEDDYNNFIKPI